MSTRICVVIPVYNQPQRLEAVLTAAAALYPVIVVNDGSDAATSALLRPANNVTLLSHPRNLGKAAALQAGFAEARRAGFTHVITMDADGQHSPADLPRFADLSATTPGAHIIGQRDLRSARAPLLRRCGNALNAVFFQVQTGLDLVDSLCGFRVYPLAMLERIDARATRYSYELEILVRAARAGVPIMQLPVQTDYASSSARVSHFRPVRDFLAIALVHAKLLWERARIGGHLAQPPAPAKKAEV